MENPWYHHITIDLLARVLQRSIFQPFLACLVPLCQRAVGAQYESRRFVVSCVYAAVVVLLWCLQVLNKRVAYGMPRVLDWDDEVVVITGGSSGLGKILAETYGMRGASVAILDVREPENESEGLAGVHYYRCDVGNADEIELARSRIVEDVCTG